ncbi:MAG: type IV pilus assembly protein PilM, partial [Planctomycetia bacterium]|nr:type IV pilus assembly protein PilM [Planctomycetia bacterium]
MSRVRSVRTGRCGSTRGGPGRGRDGSEGRRPAGLVKFIKLPPVEKKRIPDIVKFEARQQIPFALEEVVWDYQQIGDDDEEGGDDDFMMAEVGLFAMKRDQINRAILPFRVAGIEVDIVQMGPIALYNFITFDRIKGSGSKDSVVLLDIGADNTDLIITDGVRIWQRNVPIGGNHFTRALTKELKLTFAKAEHLKRNATKAPDPRSIFTAMRGVFNDFASEVNRSIGFYGSVNKGSKITKVIGLGNGFKLPGLQKFLQQNLTAEIEKLEEFARMTGDEVKGQPVFQDNLPSFAVAYGLGLQGLSRSALRTNLLPPEIEQIRLIRAKKPWALAASALLMLGFSALFLGDYRVFAKVTAPAFQTAVAAAKSATDTGEKYKADYGAATAAWQAKYGEGEKLVGSAADRATWPDFLKTLSAHFPDPVRDYGLDPKKPENQHKLDILRVHVDAIKPVWRTDLAKEWFDDPLVLKPELKSLMHPIDRTTPPTGEGWVVQVVGHHYNPQPSAKELVLPETSKARTEFGTYGYLIKKIIPALNNPRLRLYGVHHVVLAWMVPDKKWTSEKGAQSNGLATTTVPILARATPPVEAAGGEGAPGGSGMGPGMPGGMPGGMGGGMNPMMMPGGG